MIKLAIGLVIKGGEQFIEGWLACAEKLSHNILVVDNGADPKARALLLQHPKVKQYLIQNDMGRNQSRDYQKILVMAREENCDWILNLDIDEFMPLINGKELKAFLLNYEESSIGFPLFEMRNDRNHYIMVMDNGKWKHGRLCHKCYKPLSHFAFDLNDIHGQSIPHNCPRSKSYITLPIQHFGHMTKELRDEKREKNSNFKDSIELDAVWMKENDEGMRLAEFNQKTFNAIKRGGEANEEDINNSFGL